MAMNTPLIHHEEGHKRDFGSPLMQIILSLVVLVLFSWFMVKPKLAQFNAVSSAVKSAEAQLAGIEQDKEDLSKLVGDLRSASDDVAKVDEALPLNDRVSKVYLLMDSLVRSSGMTLTLISQDDVSSGISAADKKLLENPFQTGRQLHTISLSTSISGSMEQFKNLLQLMETNGRVLDIHRMEVIGGEPLTKFRLDVKAYAYEKPDVKATAARAENVQVDAVTEITPGAATEGGAQ